ncbi:MAG: hypothetical protein IPL31_17765 [Saprospiraceae bacterium]|nr:hypothetical protein [Saprospiraceae bacterium]
MKSYFEKLTDDKDGKQYEVEVKEYCYEDWMDGASSMSVESGRLRIVSPVSNELIYIAYLPFTEYNKIIEHQKRNYELRVERLTNLYINIFQQRYNRSGAKDRLLKIELELYKKLFFEEKLPIYSLNNIQILLTLVLPLMNFPDFTKFFSKDEVAFNKEYKGEGITYYDFTPYHSVDIQGKRDIFKRVIVEGIKDYRGIGAKIFDFETNDYSSRCIQVEAMYKYFNWLKENFESDGKEIMGEGCCPFTRDVLIKATSLGLTKEEYQIFKEVFIEHPFTDFGHTVYRDTYKNPDVYRMFSEIKLRVELIENNKRKILLIQLCLDDLNRDNQSPDWTTCKLGLIKLLSEYLDLLKLANETNIIVQNPVGPLANQDIEEILTEISNSENKFWKGLPMAQVVKHFEVLSTRKSKNGNNFLTQDQLVSFLKRGFLNEIKEPIQKINCSRGEKGLVIKRFYELFDLAVREYNYPNKKQNLFNYL